VRKELEMTTNVPDNTVVDVKSAWLSKINWAQALGVLASILVFFGIDLTPEVQAQLLIVINGIAAVVTWALRTFFTKTVTPSAAAKS
jgi:hypothetical protein